MRLFISKTIMEELRIRVFRILIGFSATRFTSHLFPEEPIPLLAKPYLTLPYSDLSSIRTRLTEASSTYVTTFLILCPYSAFPCPIHQIRCLLILSCYEIQREAYSKLFYLSGFRLFLFSLVTSVWVVFSVWHFSYCLSTTSTNLLRIKLQPEIYDYIMLTVRTLPIPPIRSQVPVMVICLPESKATSFKTCLNNRRISRVRPLFVAALFTPPDIWCQIVGCSPPYVLVEPTILAALIIPVYEKQLSG